VQKCRGPATGPIKGSLNGCGNCLRPCYHAGLGAPRPVCSGPVMLLQYLGNFHRMNRFEKLLGLKGEAKLRYLDGEFQVLSPGDFVRCAVTGEPIMLPDLRYWSVELQEAYANAEISFGRFRARRAGVKRGGLAPCPAPALNPRSEVALKLRSTPLSDHLPSHDGPRPRPGGRSGGAYRAPLPAAVRGGRCVR